MNKSRIDMIITDSNFVRRFEAQFGRSTAADQKLEHRSQLARKTRPHLCKLQTRLVEVGYLNIS